MIKEDDAFEYEVGSTSLLGGFVFVLFPQYFHWIAKRRYSRYLSFVKKLNEDN